MFGEGRDNIWRREPADSLKEDRSMEGITRLSERWRSKAVGEQWERERSSDWVRVVKSTRGRESRVSG